jgi:multiple sugar transport system ATP-binding protein/lactose/L-arabinose transport system ATP-binding protein
VAGFIGSPRMNFLKAICMDASAEGVTVRLGSGGQVMLPLEPNGVSPGQALEVGVRPDDFATPKGEPDPLRLEFDVDLVEHLGNATYLYGAVGGEALVARAPVDGKFAGPMGRLTLSVARSDCHLFNANGRALRRKDVPQAWN